MHRTFNEINMIVIRKFRDCIMSCVPMFVYMFFFFKFSVSGDTLVGRNVVGQISNTISSPNPCVAGDKTSINIK